MSGASAGTIGAAFAGVRPEHRRLFWQLVRFGVAGGAVTALQAVMFAALLRLAAAPQIANLIASALILLVAYVAHSRFSFHDVGTRGRPLVTGGRFLAAHVVGWLLNSGWVELAGLAHRPAWWATVPMLAVTPLVLFAIKRFWVFR